MPSDAEVARKTLEVLAHGERWGKGSFHASFKDSSGQLLVERYCLGGAWSKAISRGWWWLAVDLGNYQAVADVIRAQYPEKCAQYEYDNMNPLWDARILIAAWNDDPERTWADVEAVLEKIALEEE